MTQNLMNFGRTGKLLLALILFPVLALAQDGQGRFLLGLNLGGSGYSHIEGASIAISPELRGAWTFSDASALELAIATAEFQQDFDTPGGPNSLLLSSMLVELDVSHRFLTAGKSFGIHGMVGTGVTSIHHPEVEISMGALGSSTLPSSSDTRMHIATGVRLAQHLFSMITLNVGTNVRFLSPFADPEIGYSVFGGLSLEVL